LVDELEDLQDYMQEEFGWQPEGSYLKRGMLELEDGERVEMEVNGADADDELGDYAPTVVDLTPEQQKLLNGSDIGNVKETSSDDDEESEDDIDLDDMDTRY
jgi:A1 cistron-splicing factor AAR2